MNYRGSRFTNAARVHTGFRSALVRVNNYASQCSIKVIKTNELIGYTEKSFLVIWHYFSVFFYFSGAGNAIVINRIKQTARTLRARVNKEGTQASSLKNIPLSWQ